MKAISRAGTCVLLGLMAFAVGARTARADIFLVSLNKADRVEEFSANGTDLGAFANATTGNLSQPQGLAMDAAGNVYISNALGNTVQKFAFAGVNLGVFASRNLYNPQQLVFDHAGNLYVPNYFGRSLQRLSANGTYLGGIDTGTAAWSAVFDAAGNLYVSEPEANRVEKFSGGFDVGPFINGGNLNRPLGLIFDPGGNLLVANYNSGKIEKYSPAGVDLGPLNVANISALGGLAYDSAGNLYVSSQGNDQIHKISASGADLGVFANTGSGTEPASILALPIVIPVLTTAPANLTISAGGQATFAVAATGFALQYQWQLDGANLTDGNGVSGSASPTLQISRTARSDAGKYTVVVSNGAGAVVSPVALLTVESPDQRDHRSPAN
jgi:Immunoglobulin I-set domain